MQIRENAKALHQSGDLAQAQVAYEQLLQIDNKDPDILGLLALCNFQMDEKEKAFARWRAALSIKTNSRVAWRNLNNALAASMLEPKGTDLLPLLPQFIHAWDDDAVPKAADISLAQSLFAALEKLNCLSEIDHLLPSFILQVDVNNPDAVSLIRWALEKNINKDSRSLILRRLELVEKPEAELLLLTGACHFASGEVSKSEIIAEKVASLAPVYLTEAKESQKLVVGVLNRPPPAVIRPMSVAEFHFNENTPTSFVKQLSNELRLLSIFPNDDASHALAALGATPDLIINNWATAEILATPGTLESVNHALQRLDVPVLNAPHQVAMTTRQRNAERLQGIEDVVVPRVVRFENWNGNEISVALTLEKEIGFPLILREPFQQMGRGAIKVETAGELLSELATLGTGQFYAIAFVDNALAPGLYRKFRAAVIGDKLFITHVHFGQTWNVHRVRDQATLKEIEVKIQQSPQAKFLIENSETAQSSRVMSALERLRKKIPLDIFGIDFDVLSDDRVLFFEANAAMNISFGESGANSAIRARMRATLLHLLKTTARRKIN